MSPMSYGMSYGVSSCHMVCHHVICYVIMSYGMLSCLLVCHMLESKEYHTLDYSRDEYSHLIGY